MTSQWTPLLGLKTYGRKVAKKMALAAAGWLVIYFISQIFGREGSPLQLFGLLIGSTAGLAIGWSMATDAVEDSGMIGFPLYAILVFASWVPIGVVELLMRAILRWDINFGRWMTITSAMVMALAAAIWRASADE